jgi:hypothetical protein
MVELRRRKLTCFQKTCNGVIKKTDTTAASTPKVDSSLNPEDLAQLFDMSVASEYVTELTHFMRVISENMHSTLETFKTDLNNNLPRQVRFVVQQIRGEAQGKWSEGSPSTPHPGGTSSQGNQGILTNVGQPNPQVNPNLQQPFYQTMAYGPNIPPMGSGVPHGPAPDMFFPRTPTPYTPGTMNDVGGGMTDGIWEHIARTLREFGFTPKG